MQQDLRKTTFVHLELTDEQREQVKRQSGHDIPALELTAKELEERIVPFIRLGNHNETLAVETLEDRIVPIIRLANHNETMLDDDGC